MIIFHDVISFRDYWKKVLSIEIFKFNVTHFMNVENSSSFIAICCGTVREKIWEREKQADLN